MLVRSKCWPTAPRLSPTRRTRTLEYSNPQIPEGINTSKQHPLKEFAQLTAGILGLLLVAILILSLIAEKLVVFIPFEQEIRLAQQWPESIVEQSDTSAYLQQLMDRLTKQMTLPAEMNITVHYSDDDTVNAFATLGGHVIVHRGLLEKMPSENALAMVLGHEAAHIQLRHPIISMGRGVVIALALSALSGFGGDQLISGLLGNASMMTLMTFSRDQEREADRIGLAAVAAEYGHIGDATAVYKVLLEQHSTLDRLSPEFFSTHPLNDKRIQQVSTEAALNQWPESGHITPLPEWLLSNKESISPPE